MRVMKRYSKYKAKRDLQHLVNMNLRRLWFLQGIFLGYFKDHDMPKNHLSNLYREFGK
jgi:hypothetical protein